MMKRTRQESNNTVPLIRCIVSAGLIFLSQMSADVNAGPIFITNSGQVPPWNQHHDDRPIYNNSDTDMRNVADNGWLSYGQLAGDARVRFDNDVNGNPTPLYRLRNPAAPGNTTDFAASDFYTGNAGGNDLAGGGWSCAPTSTGMWMEWLRSNKLSKLANRGGEVASITDFALQGDTNDQNGTIRVGDAEGHLGTYRPDMVNAANDYVRQGYPGIFNALFGPRISTWNYSANGFKRLIDRNSPPVVFYQNVNSAGGHVVVGIGYDKATNEAIVADPWDATVKRKNMGQITDLGGGGAGVLYGNTDPVSAAFDEAWTGARMQVVDVSDQGDAPSQYLFNRPTGHLSGDREWLGTRVTGEVDPFSAIDDPDHVANVGNHDAGDDGIAFLDLDPVDGKGLLRATISSISGLSLDPLFEEDIAGPLYLNGWVDWNRDFVWEMSEQIVALTVGGDFDGSLGVEVAFDIPGDADGEYWARFRLARGEDIGPYGFARFGEVEDYRITVPEPSLLSLIAIGVLGFHFVRLGTSKKYQTVSCS